MAKRKVTVESGLHRGDYRSLTYWNMFKKDQRVIWMLAALVIIGSACIIFAGNNRILLIAGILLAACPLLTIALMEYNILKVLKKGHIEQRTAAYYTIDDQGISAHSQAVPDGMTYRWEKLSSVYENARFYIFFINRVQMLTIRKTDLEPKARQTMLELMEKNLPAEKLHLRS